MTVLRIEHLQRAFGSLVVTNDVDLTVEDGERHVIIGPNGAGKTSLINQIGGQLAPGAGRILLGDHDITGWPPDASPHGHRPHVSAQQPLSRTSRWPRICGSRSQVTRGNPLDFFTPARRDARVVAHARGAAGAGASRRATATGSVRNLSYGEQRQLEIGVALAGEPVLLLLDEPTSGHVAGRDRAHDRA